MGLGQLVHAIPFDQLLIQTINGIVTGMILALVASGLTLIFGIMDVVNFAHGELFMLGASSRCYIMEKGLIRHQASSAALKADPSAIHQYMGV